jgi:hypothetical protein
MTPEPSDWTWSDKPAALGWHATLYGWEDDGTWPGAFRWDGSRWQDDVWRWPGDGPPVIAYAGPFADEQSATDWATAHDPEAPGSIIQS